MLAPTPYFSDRGCHVRIYEEAKALIAAGHEVCIVTYHLGRDMPGVKVIRTPEVPWYRKVDAGPSWHKLYLDLLLLVKAFGTARSFRPHLIHAHLHEGALIGYVLKHLLNLPLLFDYQGSLSGESLNHRFFHESSLMHRLFSRIERSINHGADGIITSSSEARRELVNTWGVAADGVAALPDGVDTGFFTPYSPREARRELGIPEHSPLVVYLGLFNYYQGLDLLLKVIVLIKSESPDIRFLLMGYPEEEYRIKAVEMKIEDVITFTGRVAYERAPLLLCAADIAVSPKLAHTEANGKLFNYMACGLPTVVFENGVNREILGDSGIYVEHGNPVLLAQSIVATLKDRRRVTEIGMEMRARAVALHSWDTRAARMESLYRGLLSGHGREKAVEG